jgi:nanoRNase/pAp phosphatase (c-di-AMP/oligoRNAs hydrolase)
MEFCTVVNCMDGRVQIPVINFLKEKCKAEYVDSITEPGPNYILAEESDFSLLHSIRTRLDISVKKHQSRAIAIVGHHDCAGNPRPKDQQLIHIAKSKKWLKDHYPNTEVIGLWVDENWEVTEV